MSSEDSILFKSLTIGKLTIPGRVVKAATSETRADNDGFATQSHIDFYLPIAKGGTPLIITGNIYVSSDGKSTPMQMGIEDDNKIPALSRLVDAVHAHGVKIFAQLSHSGREVVPAFAGLSEAVSASDVTDLSTGTRPRALTVAEIERIVERWGDAAARCKTAGFDGIEIHGGHGYLISQFLTPYTNRRTDAYGGSLENRVKLLRDIHRAIRSRVGGDFPVIMKLNGSDYLPLRAGLKTPELVEIAKIMEREGLDAVEVSVGHYESGFPVVRGTFGRCLRSMVQGSVRYLPGVRRVLFTVFWPVLAFVFNLIWRPYEGYNLRYARLFKKALSIPVICVGGFLTRAAMEAAIEEGLCDAVSIGRGFVANPLLYRQLRDGTPGPRCVDCNACIGCIGTQPVDCYHPEVRAEKDAMLAAMS
ncbi:MAG TPA: NADH:flavin oxidoreductase [Chthoniobacteraceae bacterium]|jgi:2,4-dienoyl-CoA reductase-like NADH-dependent reductase (Old Yellow Enzyme family)|nr:NADH:flavin oxidoreductase [Chthoniobacteraceae bacterium]